MIFKDGGSQEDFKQPEPGAQAARCYRMADLGTQEDSFEGKATKYRKVIIWWELAELMEDGKPFSVNKEYTMSLGKKATLKKHLESWRGVLFTEEQLKGFDPKNILGAPCLLMLMRTPAGKTKVDNVSKLPTGMTAPALVNPKNLFSLDAFTEESFAALPEWVKKKVIQSPEYQKLGAPAAQGGDGGGAGGGGSDDDIPF